MGSKRVTVRGAEFSMVQEEVFNDLELLDWLDEITSGNVLKLQKVLQRLLGDEWERARDVIRDDRGVVRADAAAEFLGELLEAVGAKN